MISAETVRIEPSPNVLCLKFFPGIDIMGGKGTLDIDSREKAKNISPLALRFFMMPGVNRVFLEADYVSVTVNEAKNLTTVRTIGPRMIADHFQRKLDLITQQGAQIAQTSGPATFHQDPVLNQIEQVMQKYVNPSIAKDGGRIMLTGFDAKTGTAEVLLQGACAGCSMSQQTLSQGVERVIMHFVPAVKSVKAITASPTLNAHLGLAPQPR